MTTQINTFTSTLAKVTTSAPIPHAPLEQCKHIASLYLVAPKLSLRDSRKTDKFLQCIYKSAIVGDKGAPMTEHLEILLNAIQRFNRINAGALDGGIKLKQWLMDLAWIAYAKLSVHGADTDHYSDGAPYPKSHPIKSTAKGCQGWVFYKPQQRVKKVMPDSQYPDNAWNLLELADMFR